MLIEQINEYAKLRPFMGRRRAQSDMSGRDTVGSFREANDKWLRNQDGSIRPSSSL